MKKLGRRQFVKTAVVAGVATAFPGLFIPRARAAWEKKSPVHPHVDNLRVVGLTDPAMTKAVDPAIPWARQNELVKTPVVWQNLDRLACALTRTRDEAEGWKTIFVKPPAKSWSDAVVAIKVNNVGAHCARNAVVAKMCRVLTDIVGVKGANLHIYDGCTGRDMDRKTPFFDLPKGCRLEGAWGGIRTSTAVPGPWPHKETACLDPFVTGAVDIVVNIALCKGHDRPHLGDFTMATKNHLGTFAPKPAHALDVGLDYLFCVNQTREILGEMDAKTGRVLYPRQQVCVLDALWSSKTGPSAMSSDQTNFLAMGVLAPILDYQVATKIRAAKMGWSLNTEATKRYLTDFGFSESDLPEGGKIIEPA